MKIVIGNDHAGVKAKFEVISYLNKKGIETINVGTDTEDSCDYPDFAHAVGKKVVTGEADFGIVICGSGEGISIAANKIKGIRCGIAYNDEVAKLMRQHNNANVISFGARFMTIEEIIHRIDIFLATPFEGGRHANRVAKIENI